MAQFHFNLVSPDEKVLEGDFERVDVQGVDGDFGVLAGHAPLIAILKPGLIWIVAPGVDRGFVVTGGFAEVGEGGLTVLADTAVPVETYDKAQLAKLIEDEEERLADIAEGAQRDRLQERLSALKVLKQRLG